jgi:chromosome segregation ATPase
LSFLAHAASIALRQLKMSEDITKQLSETRSFQERVLAELAAIQEGQTGIREEQTAIRHEQITIREELAAIRLEVAALSSRLTSLEERVDARLRETRPIWEAVQSSIKILDEKFNLMVQDLYDLRGKVGFHDKFIKELERRLNL